MFCKSDTNVLVALGANLPTRVGGPAQTLTAAVDALTERGCAILARSHCYETPCFPEGAGPDYVNAVVSVSITLTAQALLEMLHDIEASFGRLRGDRWGARGIDLDLLACGDTIWPDLATFRTWQGLPANEQVRSAPDGLVLPHPRIQDRGFVLVPLADVAPNWIHPVLGRSVTQMLDALGPDARRAVKRLPDWAALS
ncbi:MAG: 2-amino-4-hydroxy-6-hydroxymethyldihydropteridine diphosphokinase [Rhodobacteraceae bacterium]|nr:2-amino-4-hydroxy-6-hydroxymethyldihydropteridine diphosphokinase [Paracoccaceae bacterium]